MIQHPLINDAGSLNNEELASKISDLHKKLSIASRLGNSYLIGQIRMAIASYQEVYSRNLQEQYKNSAPDIDKLSDKIDIT
jgi:hypothetical protein